MVSLAPDSCALIIDFSAAQGIPDHACLMAEARITQGDVLTLLVMSTFVGPGADTGWSAITRLTGPRLADLSNVNPGPTTRLRRR
jgi:hypothetical protein